LRSLTLLDQKRQTAVTGARLSLYAGLAPSDGLKFSNETAVYCAWPPTDGFTAATTDWTETQALQSGWLNSRTRTEFYTLRHADERGRIEFPPAVNGKVEASNGLPWKIDALVMADDKGALYYTTDMPAGAAASMREMTLEDRAALRVRLGKYAPELPEGMVVPRMNAWNVRREFMSGISTSYRTNQLEQRLEAMRSAIDGGEAAKVPKRSYLAVLSENPGVEKGTAKTTEQLGYHVILGSY
jgi:hypothetical protein